MALPPESAVSVNGRTALYQQIQDAKANSKPNPWTGVVARMYEKTRHTLEGFSNLIQDVGWRYDFQYHRFVLNQSDNIDKIDVEDLILNQQTKIYDDVRNQTIILEVMKKPGTNLQTAMPIVNLLNMKSKYPKEHPKYKKEDETLVLTSRLRKFLTKVEAGTLLSDEAKRSKTRAQ